MLFKCFLVVGQQFAPILQNGPYLTDLMLMSAQLSLLDLRFTEVVTPVRIIHVYLVSHDEIIINSITLQSQK